MSNEHLIKVIENGPYVVSGAVPLTAKAPIMSEHGEPMTWKTERGVETEDQYLLCRCGQSHNKPFCDSTHRSIDWDGADHAPDETYAERRTSLGGERIEIFDDRSTCAHAGFCGNEVTNIWKMAEETGDSRIRAQAMAMVERCPSGALTYAVERVEIEPDLTTGIATTADGPLWVTGGIPVERAGGERLEPRNRVTLCRCGHSGQKPLCDGSHHDVGFTA